MHETKVNTKIGDVASPDAKKTILPPECVGGIEAQRPPIRTNPALKHIERASYEFGSLLRSLPEHLHGAALSPEQVQEMEAADTHATNCKATLLDGLQSLGRILWAAGVNEAFPADVGDCARVGMLVTEIALQIQFLDDFQEDVDAYTHLTARQPMHQEGQA